VSGAEQNVSVEQVADPILLGVGGERITFVSYLRKALRHGGFAGFAKHPDAVTRDWLIEWGVRLAEGIEPI
jgi:hypothetical protein